MSLCRAAFTYTNGFRPYRSSTSSISIESFHTKLSRSRSDERPAAVMEGKFLTGVFTEDKEVPEFCANYEAQVQQLKAKREAA